MTERRQNRYKIGREFSYKLPILVSLAQYVPQSRVSRYTQQAIVQLTGDPRHPRFNVLIRKDARGLLFTDINVRAALSPQLYVLRP